MADWEERKENYQPVRQGRAPDTLVERKPLASSADKDEIEQQRRAFWKEIAEYAGEDPLEPWLRFIKWTQDTFSAGGHQSELVPLLERCTRELQAHEKYKGDTRYVRVWLQYADCLPEPRDVFHFMKENGVGQDHALYYIAHASYLELRGSFAKADEVYMAGVAHGARPLDRLKQRHTDFQQRMARRIQRKAQQEAELGPDAADGPSRTSLGLVKQKRRPVAGGGAAGPGAGRRPAAGGGGGSRPAAGNNAELDGGGLEVFEDEELGGHAGAGGGSSSSGWTSLGSFETSRKENVQKAGAWAGARLPQRKGAELAALAAPELDVYVDEDLLQQEEGGEQGGPLQQKTLRQRLDGGGLEQDPLLLHKAAGARAAAAVGAKPAAPSSRSKAAKGEPVFAWDAAALEGGGVEGGEMSFEELRAAAYMQRVALQQREVEAAAPAEVAEAVPHGQSSPGARHIMFGAALSPVQERSIEGAATTANTTSSSLCTTAGGGDFGGGSAVCCGSAAAEESTQQQQLPPTPRQEQLLPCREDDVLRLGADGMANGERGAARPSFAPEVGADYMGGDDTNGGGYGLGGGYVEPTVTINTREAFSALNSMFNAALPHEHAHLPTASASAAAEPTVTISTREAFDAINQLFQAQLPGMDSGVVGTPAAAASHQAMSAPRCMSPLQGEELAVYEDTQFLPQGHVAAAAAAAAAAGDGGGAGGLSGQMFALQVQGEGAGGMQVYEDTTLIPGQLGGGSSDGNELPLLKVHEDTALLGPDVVAAASAHVGNALQPSTKLGIKAGSVLGGARGPGGLAADKENLVVVPPPLAEGEEFAAFEDDDL